MNNLPKLLQSGMFDQELNPQNRILIFACCTSRCRDGLCMCADHAGSSLPTAMIYASCTLTTSQTTSDPASVPAASTVFQAPAGITATTDTATVIRTEEVQCQP